MRACSYEKDPGVFNRLTGTQTLDFRDLKDWLVVNEMLFYESKHYNRSARGDDGSQVVEGIVQTRKQSVIIRAVMGTGINIDVFRSSVQGKSVFQGRQHSSSAVPAETCRFLGSESRATLSSLKNCFALEAACTSIPHFSLIRLT